MAENAVLLKEIDALPLVYRNEVADFVSYITQKKSQKTVLLEKAAGMAAEEYRADTELTAFSALDSEAFHETRGDMAGQS